MEIVENQDGLEFDVDALITDVNGKAETDFINVNNSGTSRAAKWAMPSSTYDDLTLGASGTAYIAPANGWFQLAKVAGQDFYYTNIVVLIDPSGSTSSTDLSNHLFGSFSEAYRTSTCESRVPVKKGDKVIVTYNATGATLNFRFIYAVGSEWEAQ